jgi:halogenation protein CepH
MPLDHETFDVIVVGGGPAGSTAAAFVAMQGYRVLLLEREASPIYKIGESLLPPTIHGICAMLGVSDEIKNAGFVRKLGGTFQWGKSKEPWTFSWTQSPRFQTSTSYAYQVERMKFDLILLNNARRKGVDVRERHRVLGPALEDGKVAGVEILDDAGEHRIVRCSYVIDASGSTSALARHVSERVGSPFFRNIAVFGYYLNGKRMPEPCSGNIFCAAFDRGWFWYIPLSPTLTSVGAVIGEEYSDILQQGPAAALADLIAGCGSIRDMLSNATRVPEGPYGEVRVRKDYSYCHAKFWRPGLVVIGDAACFVDPVFSSGVHLATYSGLLAARSVNTLLGGSLSEERVFTEFERRYRREYTYFHDFLVSFYDMDQDLNSYYWAARKVTKASGVGHEVFLQLVGGIAGSGERLYASDREFIQALQGIGRRFGPIQDSGDAESHNGVSGPSSLVEVPLLFADGLIPSRDGFQWTEPRGSKSVHQLLDSGLPVKRAV